MSEFDIHSRLPSWPHQGTVTLLGPGLIGGSLALTLSERALCHQLVIWDLDDRARQGIAERVPHALFTTDLAMAVTPADLLVFCIPVEFIPDLARRIVPYLKSSEVLITDVGSVKEAIVRELDPLFADKARFIGGHPMAGSEKGGFDAAVATLLPGATAIMTPTSQTVPSAILDAQAFWEALGMVVTQRTPQEHDRSVALVSHLPHLLASLLVTLALRPSSGKSLELASSGFFKATQLAAANPELWVEILFSNPDGMEGAIRALMESLDQMGSVLRGNEWHSPLSPNSVKVDGCMSEDLNISNASLSLAQRKASLHSLLRTAQHTHSELLQSRPSLKNRL